MATAYVLVVDDEPNIALSLEYLMKEQGFEVRVARDGEAALAAMGERIPDMILLDAALPKRDGYEVCQTIRRNAAWRHVRIIMLTAKGRASERDRGPAPGADDFIAKPFSTREVIERIRRYLPAKAF